MRCDMCPDYPDDCLDYSTIYVKDGKTYRKRPCGETEILTKK